MGRCVIHALLRMVRIMIFYFFSRVSNNFPVLNVVHLVSRLKEQIVTNFSDVFRPFRSFIGRFGRLSDV
jgi:hypothetical protein